jgi:hypothetical protein
MIGMVSLSYGLWARFWPWYLKSRLPLSTTFEGMWNARMLPFLYLTRYMLVALGIVEIGRLIARLVKPDSEAVERSVLIVTALGTALAALVAQGMHFQDLPNGTVHYVTEGGKSVAEYSWGPFSTTHSPAFSSGWAAWNYTGYENKPAYGEYYGIVSTMERLGQTNGCGRALWENNNDEDAYGTPMSLMLLPFWSNGCIGSMEGLYFEASGTTPYHFIATSAMSEHSSNPVRRLHYEDGDVAKGVQYLQALGVKYYLAYHPSVIAKADANPDLVKVATSGPWHVYEVKDSDLVTPLTTQPVVAKGVGTDRDKWLELGTSWFQDQGSWAALPAASGPADWQRIGLERTSSLPTDDQVLATVAPSSATPINPVSLPAVTVSDVKQGDQSISFSVDKVGVPVLVRESYFPNWKVSGGKGPYRVAPNMMVVVPTSNHVTLNYGYTKVDYLAYFLTLLGLIGLVVLWRRGPILYPGPRRGAVIGAADEPFLLDWSESVDTQVDEPPWPEPPPWLTAPPANGSNGDAWSHDLGLDTT